MTDSSRRRFFRNSGAVSAAALLGGGGLTACGGSSTVTPVTPLTGPEQLNLSATQVLAAYKAGA